MGILLDRRVLWGMNKRGTQLYGGVGQEGKGLMEGAGLELRIEKWKGFHWIHQWEDVPGRSSTESKGSSCETA